MIRKCLPAEISATAEFYDAVVKYLTEHVNYPLWTYKQYPSLQSTEDNVQADCQYVCLQDGRIIGAFVLNCDPQGAYDDARWSRKLNVGEYMVCHALAVDPALQRNGVGAQIVRFCLELAEKSGYKAIRLDVVPTNFPARRLYEKCGFRYVGDVDLRRNISNIPLFSMYEYNFR